MKPSDQFIGSLARGLSVLRTFGEGAEELTLSEVAARTSLTRAGARRILLTLVQLGYVEARGRQFRLTPRVLEIGYAYLSSMPIWQFANTVVERLVARVEETCSAAVLDLPDIVFVVRVQIRRILSGSASIGTRLPAYATSMGRALLSTLPEEELDRYLETVELTPFTRETIIDRPKLRSSIIEARKQGWCYVASELEESISGLSVPVVDSSGKAIVSLNVSANTGRIDRETMIAKFLPELQAAREEMEAQLRLRR